ncbi:MAG: hypothetical protein K0U29_09190 [Gammaproteobacteria bacterium]|nr:hypothetical protein [Gammaproteobacteria bacterium]MCH9745089.1 hypothetical protein [Gammaproteobacteria bacterium]
MKLKKTLLAATLLLASTVCFASIEGNYTCIEKSYTFKIKSKWSVKLTYKGMRQGAQQYLVNWRLIPKSPKTKPYSDQSTWFIRGKHGVSYYDVGSKNILAVGISRLNLQNINRITALYNGYLLYKPSKIIKFRGHTVCKKS